MPWIGAVVGAVAAPVVGSLLAPSGGDYSGANAAANTEAAISREQWDLYKSDVVPQLKALAQQAPLDVGQQQAIAAGNVKQTYGAARQALERKIGQTRNPGGQGYGALLAPSYTDEAGALSQALTNADVSTKAANWNRALQSLSAWQGLPQTALSAAGAAGSTAATVARAQDTNAAQIGYGYGNLVQRGINAYTNPGSVPASSVPAAPTYGQSGAIYDPYGSSSGYIPGVDAPPPQAIPYTSGSPYNYREGGAIRARYADGGEIHGPGNGTSDSVAARVKPGSYILSADTVRAIGTKKLHDLMDRAGLRPGMGGDDSHGALVRLSNGEYQVPPEGVSHYGEEFFNKLQQKYHRPVFSEASGHANGGAIRLRALPRSVEDAIFRSMPDRALGRA